MGCTAVSIHHRRRCLKSRSQSAGLVALFRLHAPFHIVDVCLRAFLVFFIFHFVAAASELLVTDDDKVLHFYADPLCKFRLRTQHIKQRAIFGPASNYCVEVSRCNVSSPSPVFGLCFPCDVLSQIHHFVYSVADHRAFLSALFEVG